LNIQYSWYHHGTTIFLKYHIFQGMAMHLLSTFLVVGGSIN